MQLQCAASAATTDRTAPRCGPQLHAPSAQPAAYRRHSALPSQHCTRLLLPPLLPLLLLLLPPLLALPADGELTSSAHCRPLLTGRMTSSLGLGAMVAAPVWRCAARTRHSSNHRHRPTAARLALLCLCALLPLLSPRCSLAATVYGTWIHLSIDPSTAPSSGFCDQWVGVDAAHSRLMMVGGDDGDGTSPVGTFALDYSASFTSPVWVNLTVELPSPGSINSPYIGGGPQGALISAPSTLARSFQAERPELIVWGGHSLVDSDFFNAAFESSLGTDSASWLDDSASTTDMPDVAWAATAWGDNNETRLFMYGGTVAPAGVDSSDLWLLDLTESPAVWRNISGLCTGDLPRPLSGSRMQFDPAGNQLVLMGGYSCTTQFATGLGKSTNCFSNSVWLMSLSESSMFHWTAVEDPNPGPSSTWPSPRAWHSTVLYGSQLWVFGGQYQDASATVYFLNDVQVFDVVQRMWQTVSVKGATPPVMWSQTSNLVLSPDDGIWHMVNIGGCTASDYYPDAYALKLDTAVQADNCQVMGPGMTSATAGVPAYLLIQTRQALNVSNSTLLSSTGEQAGHNVVFGDILTYGVQLDFDVLVIGQVAGVSTQVQSSIVELGNGLYNVSYVAYGGTSSSCGNVSEPAKVTVSITLGGQYLPWTPFNVPVLPALYVSSQTSVSGETDAVQGKPAYITVQPADAYGNVAQGALNASQLVVEVDEQPLPVTAVSTATDGVYEVQYVAPSQAQYTLAVWLDGEPVSGSPFSISPLANMDISTSEETSMRVLAGLASLCLVVAMGVLYYTRSVAKVKAASPLFLFLILVGCQLALVGVLLPVAKQPSTSTSTCGAYAYTLSVGFTLAVSSLVVKTWRIARIFDRRKIKVRVITDRALLLPVAVLVASDVVLNGIWLGVDPLLPSDFVSSSNALLHFTACSSRDTLLWYALMFVPKGLLLAYGVVLASQVRNVPSAFNESKWIGFAVYNIAFCSVILLAILLLLTSSPASVYVIRSIGVIWCVLVTSGLMLLPKLQSQAMVDPAVPSSSDHKTGLSDHVLLSSNTLKGYDSSNSTVRTIKMNTQSSLPLNAVDLSGLPPQTHRSVWQKSARATSTPSSSKAVNRTIVNSAEFKWSAAMGNEPPAATAKQQSPPANGRDEPTLPSLSMAVVPLHSPRSRRAAPSDADPRQRVNPTVALAEAERVIAQLRAQLSALSAVVDAITLNTPFHTDHGLALTSHSIYATLAAKADEQPDTKPPTAAASVADAADAADRMAELNTAPPTDPISAPFLSATTLPPLSPPPPAAVDGLSDAAASPSIRHLSALHETGLRLAAAGRSPATAPTTAALQDDWMAYEAAALSRLEAHETRQSLIGAGLTSVQPFTSQPRRSSDMSRSLSALLSHPVCVALLKTELSAVQSVHLLLFVLHCQRYRMLQSPRLRRAVAARLHATFLSSSAPQRIELTEPLLSAIAAAVAHSDEQQCTAALFDDAEAEVASAMERKLMARMAQPNNATMGRCQTLLQVVPWH